MKPKLDIDKIAKDIGAKRIGKIHASGGYFGAMQLAAEVANVKTTPTSGTAQRGAAAHEPNSSS
jgi:hypothetical protein